MPYYMQSPQISSRGLSHTATPVSCDFSARQREETHIFYVILAITSVDSQLHVHHRENPFFMYGASIFGKSYPEIFVMLQTKSVAQVSGPGG